MLRKITSQRDEKPVGAATLEGSEQQRLARAPGREYSEYQHGDKGSNDQPFEDAAGTEQHADSGQVTRTRGVLGL